MIAKFNIMIIRRMLKGRNKNTAITIHEQYGQSKIYNKSEVRYTIYMNNEMFFVLVFCVFQRLFNNIRYMTY